MIYQNKKEAIKKLTLLRNNLAKEYKLERFKIFQNKTIEEIAVVLPVTLEELSLIKGIGPKKLKQFGPIILDVIKELTQKPAEQSLFFSDSFSEVKEEKRVFTVSNFLNHLNSLLGIQDFFVQGEISGFQTHSSGVYFFLKDKVDGSILNCYLGLWLYQNLGLNLEDGLEVEAGGVPNIYKPKGKLSFRVESVKLVGEGALKKAYDFLKKKLEVQGLFQRKRSLPEFIQRIGLITSRTGAVIDDFRKNLEPRGLEIFFKDARVEGVRATREIINSLVWFNENDLKLDVLVIMRGGGSLEDLQAFNQELVARAIFASRIPTIVAIGHDRDIPIASLVADAQTSTPTAAAMLINSSWERLKRELPRLRQEIFYNFEKEISDKYSKIENLTRRFIDFFSQISLRFRQLAKGLILNFVRLENQKRENELEISQTKKYLIQNFSKILEEIKEKIIFYKKYLSSADPARNLKLGYSIITNQKGKVIKEISQIKLSEELSNRLSDGEFISLIKKIINNK